MAQMKMSEKEYAAFLAKTKQAPQKKTTGQMQKYKPQGKPATKQGGIDAGSFKNRIVDFIPKVNAALDKMGENATKKINKSGTAKKLKDLSDTANKYITIGGNRYIAGSREASAARKKILKENDNYNGGSWVYPKKKQTNPAHGVKTVTSLERNSNAFFGDFISVGNPNTLPSSVFQQHGGKKKGKK